jgi:tetratricopeptide (TPR) repeat protein
VFGSEHLDVGASFYNLSMVYDSLGQCEKALEYYEKSLDIKIRVAEATTWMWRCPAI